MKKKTLVFGASLKTNRYSNLAVQRLVANKIDTVAFGLKSGIIEGVGVDTELLHYENLHTITLYINPKRQEGYYHYLIALRPDRIIFNPGTENPEFYKLLRANGISYEVACTLVLLSTNQY